MHKKWAESPISIKIDGFPPSPPVHEYHGTNLILLKIIFCFVCLYEDLGFWLFKNQNGSILKYE